MRVRVSETELKVGEGGRGHGQPYRRRQVMPGTVKFMQDPYHHRYLQHELLSVYVCDAALQEWHKLPLL